MLLYVFDMFHILLSGDSLRDRWNVRLNVCMYVCSGFVGLGVPKFAGSNPAEAVGFLGRKNPQHAFLRR